MALLLRGGTVVTMNGRREVLRADVRVDGDTITQIGKDLKAAAGDEVLDVAGHLVIPGLIQVHTHLCQTLFRGFADDLQLLDWLQQRIWPMESGHSPESLKASSCLGLLEMQLLGTTTILDMGTVKHTDVVFETAAESGMRFVGGKCLMDLKSASGPLYEPTADALRETDRLIREWTGRSPLIEYALCPRFVISCTEKLLKTCADLQREHDLYIHTHASESKEEIAVVKKRSGKNNVDYLDHLGLLGPKTVIVHGVHLTKRELKRMIATGTKLVHCPSSNLKLASGIAPIFEYRQAGLKMGLGSDGAPCNNTMDPFLEMRLAALLQKPRYGPEAMPAREALYLATKGGAEVLGKADKLGSIETGKHADLVVVDVSHPSVATVENPYSALVYSCSGRDVRHVVVNGRVVVRDRRHWKWSAGDVTAEANAQRKRLFSRIGLI
jgi:5-methylthioadenosine/S-adenosylhomocysteine deaminase